MTWPEELAFIFLPVSSLLRVLAMRPNKTETLCVPSTISSSISPLPFSLSLSLSLLLLSLCLSLATPFIRISTMNYVYFSYFSLRSRPSNIRTRLCASMPYFSRYNIIENQIPTYRVCSKQFKHDVQLIRTCNVKWIEGILFTEWNTDVAS